MNADDVNAHMPVIRELRAAGALRVTIDGGKLEVVFAPLEPPKVEPEPDSEPTPNEHAAEFLGRALQSS